MDNQARTKIKPKRPSPRPKLEPISYEEIMGNAGMSGFVSFLDAPRAETAPVAAISGDQPPAQQVSAGSVIEDSTIQDNDTVQVSNTVKQSATVLNLNTVVESGTVAKPDTVLKTYTVLETDTVLESKAAFTPPQVSTVQETYTVSSQGPIVDKASRLRRAQTMEDGHSLAEQEVYRTLWRVGQPEDGLADANRLVRIGYDRLANLVRLSWVTVKANLRSLERKLAIEVVAAEDSANREGKQYRIFSPAVVWSRREAAGLMWVRRTRGVELLTNAAFAPGQGVVAAHRNLYRTTK